MKNRRTGLMVALVVVLSLLVLAPSMALSDSNSSKNSSVTIRVETDKPSYLRGQVVKIKVYVINSKNEAVMYPTMIGYSVYNSKGGNVVGCYVCITWASPIPTFPPQSETVFQSLSSGDSTFEWNQKNANRRNVRVGTYTIKVSFNCPEISSNTEITIRIYPNLDAFPRPVRWGFY
jgi:hypothetical protein